MAGARRYWWIWIAVVPVEANGRETFDFLSANIRHGTAEPEAVVALVDRFHPDLLSIQELTPSFARRLAAVGLYPRLPMTALRGEAPFFFRMPRARLTLPDGRTGAGCRHPSLPADRQQRRYLGRSAGQPAPHRQRRALGSRGRLQRHPRPIQARDAVSHGYRDAGAVAGKGLEPTFPRNWGTPALITIDHVLADHRLGVVEYSVEELPGSDHRAIHTQRVLP